MNLQAVAVTIADDPAVLQFPLTWILASCVLEGLRHFGRPDAAARLLDTMTPLRGELNFSAKCCAVGAELLAVYSGHGSAVGMLGGGGGSGQLMADEATQAGLKRGLQEAQMRLLRDVSFCADCTS